MCRCGGYGVNKLLVFTDLDASLLNHHDYSWQAAAPALAALREHGFPLILNSSKTRAELLELRRELHNPHPFISENGALAVVPAGYFPNPAGEAPPTTAIFETHLFGKSYRDITGSLAKLRAAHGYRFQGFNDMDDAELAQAVGLSLEQAAHARQREASEPIIWRDSEAAFEAFQRFLAAEDLMVVSGGRFRHVMSRVDKGMGVHWLSEQYRRAEPDTRWLTVAIGDGPNDASMLARVDVPILIPNPACDQSTLTRIPKLTVAPAPGATGWNQAVLEILQAFPLGRL